MRGPVGTSIKLTVRRKNVKKPLEFDITRKIIEVKSVNSEILGKNKNLGYIRLKSFNENSDKQLLEMVKKYDHVRSKDTDHWLNYVGMKPDDFIKIADSFRSDKVWAKLDSGEWKKRNIWD